MKMNVIYVQVRSAIVKSRAQAGLLTFIPYCNFATSGFPDMKVKSLRFIVYGRGTMSSMKMLISSTSSANT